AARAGAVPPAGDGAPVRARAAAGQRRGGGDAAAARRALPGPRRGSGPENAGAGADRVAGPAGARARQPARRARLDPGVWGRGDGPAAERGALAVLPLAWPFERRPAL